VYNLAVLFGVFLSGTRCIAYISFSPMIVFQVFISYTGGQSVSHVLLWQPSECVNLINIVILFSENKYDDDDDV